MGSNFDAIDTYEKQTIKKTLTGTKEKWMQLNVSLQEEPNVAWRLREKSTKRKSKNITNIPLSAYNTAGAPGAE